MLHRYRSLNRWPEAAPVYLLTRRLFPLVRSITGEAVDQTQRLMDRHRQLSARDAVHAAVVLVDGLEGICSYDRDFDIIRGLQRFQPDVLSD